MRRRLVVLAALACCFLGSAGPLQAQGGAQETKQEVKNRDALLDAAREMIMKVRFCALVTIDEEGDPQVRTMDPFPPQLDWAVWMATNASTRKVLQIRDNARVALHYFDPADPGYVTLTGKARLVSNPVEKGRHWKPEWAAFYADEHRGEDYLLIEFRPDRLEIVSTSRNIASEPSSWSAAVVEFEHLEH